MKKVNSIIIATIIATFVISMFAFQTTTTEASNNVSPTATPSPRKIRKLPRKSIEVENDETHLTRKPITKVKTKQPTSFGAGNQVEARTRKTTRKSSKSEVSIETLGRNKQPRRKRKN